MPSIAGYNSIYYKEILKKYRYNTLYPFNIDDIEINFRISQDGYTFLHAKTSHIYHRMDEEIGVFLKQMTNYGKGAMNTSKIHKKIARIYLPI
jgi:cellulose synthase/poly-beta-1,6-N-acetylglucosamine synthase-like glycosyltransferase